MSAERTTVLLALTRDVDTPPGWTDAELVRKVENLFLVVIPHLNPAVEWLSVSESGDEAVRGVAGKLDELLETLKTPGRVGSVISHEC